jgi:hypothetical protein
LCLQPGIDMENLFIEATVKTPFVSFNQETGAMLIQGRSIPQDAELFWDPILKWFYAYAVKPASNTNFIFEFEYFNISSSKRVLFLLYKLAEMYDNGIDVSVVWRCQDGDPDMKEVANDYKCMVDVPFQIVDAVSADLSIAI